jgi:protein TonB
MRSSADGKATTCLRNGETVEEKTHLRVTPPAASSSATLQPSHQPQRVRVSQGVTQGLIISKVQPVYPADARLARIQGNVILKALISETGDIANLDVLSGHPMLVLAAMDAVKQWKYHPYLLQGKPVQVETQITVNFTLSDN